MMLSVSYYIWGFGGLGRLEGFVGFLGFFFLEVFGVLGDLFILVGFCMKNIYINILFVYILYKKKENV